MKKVISILLALIVCVSVVYSEEPKVIELTLTVGEHNIPKWFAQEVNSTSWSTTDDLSKKPFDESRQLVLYPSVKTNNASKVVLTVTGEVMAATDVSSKIKVTATGEGADDNNNSATWSSESTDGSIVWTEKEAGTSDRVISEKLTVTLDEADYNAALPSELYSATLTLKVTDAS